MLILKSDVEAILSRYFAQRDWVEVFKVPEAISRVKAVIKSLDSCGYIEFYDLAEPFFQHPPAPDTAADFAMAAILDLAADKKNIYEMIGLLRHYGQFTRENVGTVCLVPDLIPLIESLAILRSITYPISDANIKVVMSSSNPVSAAQGLAMLIADKNDTAKNRKLLAEHAQPENAVLTMRYIKRQQLEAFEQQILQHHFPSSAATALVFLRTVREITPELIAIVFAHQDPVIMANIIVSHAISNEHLKYMSGSQLIEKMERALTILDEGYVSLERFGRLLTTHPQPEKLAHALVKLRQNKMLKPENTEAICRAEEPLQRADCLIALAAVGLDTQENRRILYRSGFDRQPGINLLEPLKYLARSELANDFHFARLLERRNQHLLHDVVGTRVWSVLQDSYCNRSTFDKLLSYQDLFQAPEKIVPALLKMAGVKPDEFELLGVANCTARFVF